jgi:hypothetical protein
VLTPAELSLMSAQDVAGLGANGGPNGGPHGGPLGSHDSPGSWQGERSGDPARDNDR